jgi:hypothetical protein
MVAELACAIPLFVLVSLIGLNGSVLVIGSWLNDTACREAARVAAQEETQTRAEKTVNYILQRFKSNSPLLQSPELVAIKHDTSMVHEGLPDRTEGGPLVSVTTQTTVTLPAPILIGADPKVRLAQTYVFPIVRIDHLNR